MPSDAYAPKRFQPATRSLRVSARRLRGHLGCLGRAIHAASPLWYRGALCGALAAAVTSSPAQVVPSARAPRAAQRPADSASAPRATHLRFRHLGVDDGLPSSVVSDIIQDRRGFMWIGSWRGVSRYDGHQFRTYDRDPGNARSLAHDHVEQVYEDRQGTLWVVTPEGLCRYDRARDDFATYLRPNVAPRAGADPAGARFVTRVLEDARGTFWVGTTVGLYRLDRRTGTVTPFALPASRRSADGAAAQPHVMTMYEDRVGAVWIGSRSGLDRLDPSGGEPRHYGYDPADAHTLPDSIVLTVAQDVRGALWVGTWSGGIAALDVGSGRFTRFRHDSADSQSLAGGRVLRVVPDRAGGLWIGTENGGLDFLGAGARQFVHHRFDPNVPSGIGGNSIWSLYQDTTGTLWIGTYSGGLDVSIPQSAAIDHFRAVPADTTSLSHNVVSGFTQGPDGRIWVTTDGGGLNRFDPATGRFDWFTTRNTNLNSAAVVAVVVGRRGDVWVSTWGGGLSLLDERRRRFTAYTRRNSNIPDEHAFGLLEDRAGQLWIGTINGVVAMFDRTRRTFTRRYTVAPPGRPESPVMIVRELRDGRFAVGLRGGGVTILDPATGEQTHHVARLGGLSGNGVYALLETEPGTLWIGTDHGLDRLALGTGHVTRYTEADGLPSRLVSGIVADDAGQLWVSTDRGLCRFDPRTRVAKTFTRPDGLQGNEFLMHSALHARDGTLYFGGNNGFNVIRPDRIVENRRPPRVAFTGLQLFNRPAPVGMSGSPLPRPIGELTEIELRHDQNVVTFEFAALDFAAPGKNRYAYRLDGFDTAWQQVGGQHVASYTNLTPGRYTFRAKASNNDGLWNEAGASIQVVVTPPAWGTWWFRLLMAGAASAGLYGLWRFQQQRRLEVALARQALTDPLTGLANRSLFRDRVDHALARVAREGAPVGPDLPVAVLFLDLDGFKLVNDSLGHAAGDQLLQAVAARLLNTTRGCDTVARLGGDEFAVLLENARGATDAATVADRIVAALRAPVSLGAETAGTGIRDARVGVSVGIAFAEPGLDADALLRNADAAMYKAKADGKGRQALFDPTLVAAAAERLALETDLAHALERDEFALVYQPIVALASGEVQHAEALLRWHHPTRGVVGPAQFIPLAEGSGLIVELGRWVLNEACRAAGGWPCGADGARIGVTVNVSGRQLQDPAFPAHVASALTASGLAASQLTLEITESVLMRDTNAAIRMLHALKALGVELAIDDFGTGYSSLTYLQRFPVDVLKVDKSFVSGVTHGGAQAAIARAVITLGEACGLRTVAEGVESEAQRDALLAMGCASAQGYLFSHPLSPGAVGRMLVAVAA